MNANGEILKCFELLYLCSVLDVFKTSFIISLRHLGSSLQTIMKPCVKNLKEV